MKMLSRHLVSYLDSILGHYPNRGGFPPIQEKLPFNLELLSGMFCRYIGRWDANTGDRKAFIEWVPPSGYDPEQPCYSKVVTLGGSSLPMAVRSLVNGVLRQDTLGLMELPEEEASTKALIIEKVSSSAGVYGLVLQMLQEHNVGGRLGAHLLEVPAIRDMLGETMLDGSPSQKSLASLIFQREVPEISWWVDNFKCGRIKPFSEVIGKLYAEEEKVRS